VEMPMNTEGQISRGGVRDEHGFFAGRGESILFVVVSLMAVLGEGFLILVVVSARGASDFPIAKYLLLFFHLLPWFGGLRGMQRAKTALSQGKLDLNAMHESNGRVLVTLASAYVALCAIEILLMLIYFHR